MAVLPYGPVDIIAWMGKTAYPQRIVLEIGLAEAVVAIDVGVDYTTAISWLATNGIQLICDKDANTESIYSSAVGNPIHRALRQLCITNQIIIKGRAVNEYTPYKDIIEWFEDEKNTKVTKAKEVLGYTSVKRRLNVSLSSPQIA